MLAFDFGRKVPDDDLEIDAEGGGIFDLILPIATLDAVPLLPDLAGGGAIEGETASSVSSNAVVTSAFECATFFFGTIAISSFVDDDDNDDDTVDRSLFFPVTISDGVTGFREIALIADAVVVLGGFLNLTGGPPKPVLGTLIGILPILFNINVVAGDATFSCLSLLLPVTTDSAALLLVFLGIDSVTSFLAFLIALDSFLESDDDDDDDDVAIVVVCEPPLLSIPAFAVLVVVDDDNILRFLILLVPVCFCCSCTCCCCITIRFGCKYSEMLDCPSIDSGESSVVAIVVVEFVASF